ncbi:MAG: hypothetical protein DYG98_23130 [Haliscomenobacteraceae bacterium CHB4]|nr:hypothetical protein [Haliscomenobacteraceae bacterium CHB4]
MTILFRLLLFALIAVKVQAQPRLKATAETVLENLYQANGNKIYPKPAIEIVSDERHAAQFIRRSNTIRIGVKVFEVCRVFGKDSLAALAFIIGHELAHSFQLNTRQTSFLAYDQEDGADANAEKDADIQGLFNAWLAGYNTADLLPYIIEGVYVAYDLKGKTLSGYPTLEERKRTAKDLRLIVTELIRMYETGNYLTAIGQHDLAAACFQYVENRYKGREVYNNLGVNLVLQAMHLSEKNVDPYVFPLELDCNTRLKKPKADRGPGDLTPEQWQQRGELLAKAAGHFAHAAKMDYQYLTAEINYLCALVLNAKAGEAIEYCERRELVKKAGLLNAPAAGQEKIKLALGLAYAYSNRTEAIPLFDGLKNSTDAFVQYAATLNANVLAGRQAQLREAPPCQINFDTDAVVDDVKIHRPLTAAWTILDNAAQIEISTVLNKASELVVFRTGGQNRLSLQRMRRTGVAPVLSAATHLHALATNRGYIRVCPEKRAALLINEAQNQAVEWVKYYEFR